MADEEEIIIDLKVNGFSKLKADLKAAKGELADFEFGTKGFTEAQKKIQDLQDKLGELSDATKIQGNSVERLSSSFGLLKESIATGDVDKAKLAFSGLGKAMDAIPLFLVIEGVKLLWDNLDKVKEILIQIFPALDDVSQSTKDLEKAQKKLVESNKLLVNELDREIALLEAQGASEDMIFEKKKRKLEIQVAELKSSQVLLRKKVEEILLNDDLLDSATELEIQFLRSIGQKEKAAEIQELLDKDKALRAKEEVDKFKENAETIKDLENNLAILKVEHHNADVKEAKDANDELLKLQEQYNESLNEIEKEALAQRIKETEERIKLIDAELAAYDLAEKQKVSLRDAANKAISDNYEKSIANLGNTQKTQEQKEFDDLNKKSKERRAAIDAIYLAEVAAAGDDQGLIEAAEKKKNESMKKVAEEQQTALNEINRRGQLKKAQDDLAIAQDGAKALQGLSDTVFAIQEANKKEGSKTAEQDARNQFKINKALSMSTAAMQGAQSILAITSVPDFTLGVASALRIAGVVATTGAVIAKIAGTQFESSASSGGGAASAASTAAPKVPENSQVPADTTLFGTAGAFNNQGGGANRQGQGGADSTVVRAYVVGGNVTNQQQEENAFKQAFTLTQ